MSKLRVILADDHPIVLMGVYDLIEKDSRFEVIDQAHSPSELIRLVGKEHPDLVITDYNMPGDASYGDGARMIEYLVRNYPDVKLVVLTMISNPLILSRLYEMGVLAVIQKTGDLDEILVALDAFHRGGEYRPKQDSSISASGVAEKVNSLSVKEFEVLRHFVGGASVGEIARTLNRSLKTISSQKISAMRKLGVESDQALIEFCMQTRLFQ